MKTKLAIDHSLSANTYSIYRYILGTKSAVAAAKSIKINEDKYPNAHTEAKKCKEK